jgi:hypothetical protein
VGTFVHHFYGLAKLAPRIRVFALLRQALGQPCKIEGVSVLEYRIVRGGFAQRA